MKRAVVVEDKDVNEQRMNIWISETVEGFLWWDVCSERTIMVNLKCLKQSEIYIE